MERAPSGLHLILQREAGERFAGYPYAPESVQSLLLKPRWHVELTRRLARRDFRPPPRMESVYCWFAARERPLVEPSEAGAYARFVRSAFGARGPSIGDGLRGMLPRRVVRQLGRELGSGLAASLSRCGPSRS